MKKINCLSEAHSAIYEIIEILKDINQKELSDAIQFKLNEIALTKKTRSFWEFSKYLKTINTNELKHDLKNQIYNIINTIDRYPEDFIEKNLVKKGNKFKILNDTKIIGSTSWFKPFTGDFECVLPKGTILVADHDQIESAIGFSLSPKEYDLMEVRLVPEKIRNTAKYGGYYFVFTIDEIGVILEKMK